MTLTECAKQVDIVTHCAGIRHSDAFGLAGHHIEVYSHETSRNRTKLTMMLT